MDQAKFIGLKSQMPIGKVTSPGVCYNSASKTFNKNRKSFMANESEKSKNEPLKSKLKSCLKSVKIFTTQFNDEK